MKEWKKTFYAMETEKRSGLAILLSDKIVFKTKDLVRDKEDLFANK